MKTVAILKDKNGSCELILEIRNVDDKTYNNLVHEVEENKRKENARIREEKERICNLELKIEELEKEIRVLKGEE